MHTCDYNDSQTPFSFQITLFLHTLSSKYMDASLILHQELKLAFLSQLPAALRVFVQKSINAMYY